MRLAATVAGLAFLLAARLEGQGNRSLTDIESRSSSQGQAIIVPADDAEEPGSPELQERILTLRSSVKALTESLAIANSEGEMFKRQAADLQLKIEAYGLAGLDKDPGKIEQRLLSAVRDLRLLQKQNEDAVNQLVRLTEAIQVLTKASENLDPQARLTVETELRKTSEILGNPAVPKAEGVEPTLTDGMVVDIKEDLSLIVANIGNKQGVRTGMPFQVWREEKLVGEVRVVDVRERISGAVIQSLVSEKNPIKTGDRLRVDARQ